VLAAIPDRTTVLVDGLALGAMPAEVEREASRLRVVALIHLPLAAEIGIGRDVAARLEAGERRAVAAASLVIVTGTSTTAAMESYGVASDLITVVEPGTERGPLARGSQEGPLQLLCVATLNPGKGHDILLRALVAMPYLDWRLTCAGSLDRDPPTVQRLREKVRADGLDARVSFVGDLNAAALAACYDNADLFVLATLHETYGMAVAEALARGLPVVSTATGAIPALLGGEAGLLVPAGDTTALTSALSRVLGDRDLRARLADGARRVRDRLPTWEDAADRMAAALERVAAHG
jgi:glycosyltransferase involved in cell wall biosynthesis